MAAVHQTLQLTTKPTNQRTNYSATLFTYKICKTYVTDINCTPRISSKRKLKQKQEKNIFMKLKEYSNT